MDSPPKDPEYAERMRLFAIYAKKRIADNLAMVKSHQYTVYVNFGANDNMHNPLCRHVAIVCACGWKWDDCAFGESDQAQKIGTSIIKHNLEMQALHEAAR